MAVDGVLLGMELSGMGLHTQEYRDTRQLLEQRCRIIEEEAYRYKHKELSPTYLYFYNHKKFTFTYIFFTCYKISLRL